MSDGRIASTPSTTATSGTYGDGINRPGTPKPTQSVLERRQIEAQAGVSMLENGARLIGGFGVSSSGDDFIPRPGTPAPPAATVTPPPAQQPEPGLQVGGVEGFPAGAVRTPGGYTIVTTGDDATWKIYGPGQKLSDEPLTKVWGDPHVNEKDGTRWDFTKDSNFMLPDGTVIRADTTSETGKSFTQGLSIVSGNDRVEVTGVNSKNPKVGQPSKDGEAWMNQNAATLTQGATFTMRTDGKNVDWFRATNGKLEGVITGSVANFDGKNSYDQVIGGNGQASGANVDLQGALKRFGGQAAGGLGFLGADVESFLSQVGGALQSLSEQDSLKDLFAQNRSANRTARRR